MSLRTVHLLFIGLSALLALVVAGWAIDRYRTEGTGAYALAAAAAVAGAIALGVYGVRFRRATSRW